MKVSLNWLREYVRISMSPAELAHLLTMAGLEVEGLEPVCESLDGMVVAKIVSVNTHPNADRLSVCEVDTGEDVVEVVCGAPNVTQGMLAPLALVGARLPNGQTMKESRIRGVVSCGMLLAEDELGLTNDHSGLMTLPVDLRVGASLSSALSLPDWVLDVSITPNRPDCANVLGIAREISAATGEPLKRPSAKVEASGPPVEELTRVTIHDPEGCPRYVVGMIQNVTLEPAPFWMRYRLYQSGVRSINNLVDVTNYVMLEMGQPLHAFDYHRLRQGRIEVRKAQEGETFTTLDGESRRLSPEILLICDGERPVALAGIMGGLNSEIFAGTKDVLIESAFFDPLTTRRASKHLGLSTEASYRFERGADIEGVTDALKRAVSLMYRLGGGTVARGVVDNYSRPYSPKTVRFSSSKTNRLLGTDLSADAMKGYLEGLEMDVKACGAEEMDVTPPSFRIDIGREVDLIEEVARMSGFEKIPVTYPRISPLEVGDPPEMILRDEVRSILVGIGFTEIITYSFIAPESADILDADETSDLRSFTRLMNPLGLDQSVLRTSLLPGLMATLRNNRVHGEKDLRLFEWGKIFRDREGEQQPFEQNALAGVIAGHAQQKTWFRDERDADFYDVKGIVEALLKGLDMDSLHFGKKDVLPGFDKEVSCGVYVSGTCVGHLGKASLKMTSAYDIADENIFIFDLNIGNILPLLAEQTRFRPFPRFPAVYRDISLVVNEDVESGRIVDLIRKTGGKLLESVHIFDIYTGDQIGANEKAIAFRISYRSDQKTLDGESVNRLHERIIRKACDETGGRLREG